ncbi:1-aminocyclopropane-1-carboxylate deaminase/D-cysteine desulfhydrase [Aliamphritea hakodatensis]|uniref:1-aminocyclopropane-1-carboxylate deaminase/D-cysteine desulfhydrase n=1 Tax=Aliamphritea hakodatensis TaxID=2895352 RepID=UPI0022FD4D44|nr:pyridoxal-phosphate dependent enzyme [Aliamphritea hakodatensis]
MSSTDFSLSLRDVTPVAFARRGVQLQLLDLTGIHPFISGNKWFKLKYNLAAYQAAGKCCPLLSFGGAWSNHLHALAFAGYQAGIPTIGVIRGERPPVLSAMLQDAESWGMRLEFVSRAEYREKNTGAFRIALHDRLGAFEYLPEGGSNALAVKGCREILSGLENSDAPDFLCCACGTGATLAGLIAAARPATQVLGVPALKGADFLYDDIRGLLKQAGYADSGRWRLILSAHEGGYGKISPRLADCIERFRLSSGVQLEPLYTGKLLLALEDLLAAGEFPTGSRVVMVHTGGLQGLRGMAERLAGQLQRFYDSGCDIQ